MDKQTEAKLKQADWDVEQMEKLGIALNAVAVAAGFKGLSHYAVII